MALSIQQQQAVAIAQARRRRAEAEQGEGDRSFMQRSGDFLAAVGRGVERAPKSLGLGMAQVVADNLDSFAGRREYLEQEAARMQQERAAASGLEKGAEFATKMMPGFALGSGALFGKGLTMAPTLAGRIGIGVASGAIGGAAGEALSERTAGESRLEKAKYGAMLGAGVGGASPVVGPSALLAGGAIKSIAPKIPGALRGATEGVFGGALRGASSGLEKVGNVAVKAEDVAARQFMPKELRAEDRATRLVGRQIINKVDIDKALARIEEGRKQGIEIPLYEAVKEEAPALARYAKQVATTPGGGGVAQQSLIELSDSLPQSVTRVANRIARDGLAPEDAAEGLGLAAKQIMQDHNARLAARAKPFYDEALKAGNKVQDVSILKEPAVEAAIRRVRNNPYYASEVGGLANDDMAFLHLVKQDLDNELGKFVRSGANNEARLAGNMKDRLVKAMDESFGDYKTARGIYAEDITARNALAESPVGVLSDVADGNFQRAVQSMFKLTPNQAGQVRARFITAGAEQQFDSAVAHHIAQSMSNTIDGRFKTFSNSVFGSGQKRAVLKELLGESNFNRVSRFFDSFDRGVSARGVTGGTSTAADVGARGELGEGVNYLRQGAAGIVDMAFDAVTGVGRRSVLADPEQSEKLARYLFTRDGEKLLRELAKTKPGSGAEKRKLGAILIGGGIVGNEVAQ